MNNWNKLDKDVKTYIDGVLSGDEIAGEAIYLACKRFKDWYESDKYIYNHEKVNKVFDFIQHLKHFEDVWAGEQFILLPWQKFIVAGIFGFYQHYDPTKRVIRNVLMMISRKSGKTALAAAIILATMVCDDVQGAECFLVANNREQAKICYKFTKNFSEGLDPKHKYFQTYRDNLNYAKTKSTLKVLSSDALGNDGYNPSCFILDEWHGATNYDTYNVMKSGQAARKNPLAIIISSAGVLLDGYPLYESVKVGYDVLRGIKEDDNTFYAIFQMNENDDWQDEKNWKKASPNYGITVYKDYMEERVREAINDVSKEADVKTKNLNIWCSSINGWIPQDQISKSMQHVDLNEFKGESCYIGIDLSESNDLTAISVMLPPNENRKKWADKYIFKSLIYIPRLALQRSRNKSLYSSFLSREECLVTDGPTIDYDKVLSDILLINNNMEIIKIAFDAWQSKLFINKAEEEGLPLAAYSQSVQNFNIPTSAFTELILNNKIIMDINSAVAWMFSNVELKIDHAGNKKPRKSGEDKSKKIDVVISMLEALGAHLSDTMYYFGDEN